MKQRLSLIILALHSLTATCLTVPSPFTTPRTISKRDDTDPADRFPDGAELMVNGLDWVIPMQVSRQITIPLIPELDVIRAKIRRAPDTFHCFFSSPQNELPSASFDRIYDLVDSYPGATAITCQTLFRNQRLRTYVIWVRYADDGIDVSGKNKKEDLLNLHASENASEVIFRGEMDEAVDHAGEARKIVAAVLMKQPQGKHECALISADGKDDAERTFTVHQPISGFVMSVRGIRCYSSSEGDEIEDTYELGEIR